MKFIVLSFAVVVSSAHAATLCEGTFTLDRNDSRGNRCHSAIEIKATSQAPGKTTLVSTSSEGKTDNVGINYSYEEELVGPFKAKVRGSITNTSARYEMEARIPLTLNVKESFELACSSSEVKLRYHVIDSASGVNDKGNCTYVRNN
jgi:hypothetical protein